MPASSGTRRLMVEVGYRANEVAAGLRDTTSRVRAMASDIKSSFANAQATFDHFTNNLQKLSNFASGAFMQLEQGARRMEIRQAFEEQLGGSEAAARQWLETLEDASSGTISEFNLISSASKAMSLGVTSNLSEMESLLEIARFKARKFGTDTSTAFEDISVGVGRQSKLILDNLGIVVETDAAYAAYAESIGKVASQLTDAEKKQAFLNAVLQAGQAEIAAAGGLIDNEADKLRLLQVEWDKAIGAAQTYAALTAGRAIAPRGEGEPNQIENLFQQAATYDLVAAATNRARQELTGLNEAQLSQGLLVLQATANYEGLYNGLTRNADAQLAFNQYILANYEAFGLTIEQALALVMGVDQLTSVYSNASDAMAQYNALSYEQAAAVAELESAQIGQTQQTEKGTDATYGFATIAALAAGEAQGLATQAAILAGELYGVVGGANAAGMALANAFNVPNLNAMRNKAGSPLFELESLGSTGGGVRNVFTAQQQAFQATTVAATRSARSGVSAAEKAKREHEKIATDIARAYEKEYNRIGGFVDKALSFRGGVQQYDDLLDRTGVGRNENASDETIRRLEDVRDRALEGKRSPWITEFLGLDDANLEITAARAERLIRDIQDESKFFELVPFDKFLEDVRELEAAEARRAAFRDKAIQALGVGSTAAVDKALGIESEGEASGEELALNIISSLEAQVKAEQGRIIAAGGMFGDYFRQGFNGKFAGIVDELVSTIIEELAEAA